MIDKLRASCRPLLLSIGVVAGVMLGFVDTASAQRSGRGYVGDAYLQIPGVSGDARGDYRDWVTVDSHYWPGNQRGRGTAPAARAGAPAAGAQTAPSSASASAAPPVAPTPAAAAAARTGAPPARLSAQAQAQNTFGRRAGIVSLPAAPRSGEGRLVIAFDKDSRVLPALMERCANHTAIPEMTFAISAQRSRPHPEIGDLPASVPDYLQYRLTDVQFVECPVVEAAPQQAIVVTFNTIEWLNFDSATANVPARFDPPQLQPLPRRLSGETRAWVISWVAYANSVSDDQCPVMNERPGEADYYALVPPEEAARERIALAAQGGPSYQTGQMGMRGPNRLDVTVMPGIVADPGFAEPTTRIARGVNLDGDDGRRRHHRNYVSADGAVTGIDNQLFTVTGCIAGWQGHNGFMTQFANGQMRDGQFSLLVQVDGVDDVRNDREVYVTLAYSSEAMAKNAAGSRILRDFTFRVSESPEFTHYFARVRGRITDGVLTTEPAQIALNLGGYGTPREPNMADARMRLELKDDGTIAGVIGGYIDWRSLASTNVSSGAEFYNGFGQPGFYNALRRNADGMRNPVTGQYDGISTAFDLEGVPAFVVWPSSNVAAADGAAGRGG